MYSGYDDIKTAIPEVDMRDLTDDELTDVARTARVDRAIADADEVINSYLSGRYSVPLSDPPALIRKLSVDLAIWHLHQRTALSAVPEAIRQRYTDAIATLGRIEAGKMRLDVPASPVTVSTLTGVRVNSNTRIFNDNLLGRYR